MNDSAKQETREAYYVTHSDCVSSMFGFGCKMTTEIMAKRQQSVPDSVKYYAESAAPSWAVNAAMEDPSWQTNVYAKYV